MADAIFKGDNTAAFGGNFLTIKVLNPDLYKISKLVFVVNGGIIIKGFTDESMFQREETYLTVNFNSSETSKLSATNVGNLVAYDENGLPQTCIQTVQFTAQNGVIKNVRQCCC